MIFDSPLSSPVSHYTSTLKDPPYLSLDSNPQHSILCLPKEILSNIFEQVILLECDGSPSAYYSTVHSFSSILSTCSAFYTVGIPILYKHAAFSDPLSFDTFLTSIQTTGFGDLVRTLDFSGFTTGVGRSARMNKTLTPTNLAAALDECPNLTEFLASEAIDTVLNSVVLTKLTALPYLSAIDFCGATDSAFVEALSELALSPSPHAFPQITRLSLHGCSTIPSQAIQGLLRRLPNLARLDLTHTNVTADALLALPITARLTHLSLSKCGLLSSQGTKEFLALHPAVASLQWLNLMFHRTNPAPISSIDLSSILSSLPPVQYLNLHGLPAQDLDSIPTSNLQSLSIAYADISIYALKQFLPKVPTLQYLDLSGNPYINIWTIQDLSLLNSNPTIRMFEFSASLLAKMDGIAIPGFSAALGQGQRGWLIRGSSVPGTARLSYKTHAGPSVVSGPQVEPTMSSPDHKRFTFQAYAKSRPPSPEVVSMAGKSSRAHVQVAGRSRVCSPPAPRPVSVLGMDMGAPEWEHASRKVNMCLVGIGGNRTMDSCRERGIYLYYGYRR